MLSTDQAIAKILEVCEPLAIEQVSIDQAIGRALAAEVRAKRTLPPWDNSAMDGYAVRASEAIAGAKLTLGDTIFAGQKATRPLAKGEAARIMTGAPVPPGADAVVMQEKTKADGGGVEILEAAKPRLNVRAMGEDARAGEPLLAEGTPLGIIEAGLLWAQGETEARVRRRPVVAIVSTGDELVPVGQAQGDRIVDTNAPTIAWAVSRAGGTPKPLGIATDTPEAVKARLAQGLDADVLVTLAGVSVGDKDFVKPALESLGVQTIFWRIAIRPGKPLYVGRKGNTLVFGLPGNPLSSMVCFELYLRPALRALLGLPKLPAPRVPGRIATGFKKAPGLTHYVRATVAPGTLDATPLPTQTSGALSSGSQATHLIEVPDEVEQLKPNDPVRLIPVTWNA
ncbi:MAG: molybdopterin molybdotransferase MoeA [Myxococcaceae bacterium]